MRITIDKFVGMRPALEPHLLQDNEAQVALDVRLETGSLSVAPGFSDLKALTKPLATTIWRYPAAAETDHWLEFLVRADVARSPIRGDVWDRIYWTDDVGARYAPASIALSGSTFPGGFYALGMPIPELKPAVTAFTPGAGSTLEARVYRETFVNEFGEEGPPGQPSDTYTVNPTQPVTVGVLAPVVSSGLVGNYNVTRRRLYRSSFTGNGQAVYQLVVELPVAITSYVDTKAQADLGKELETELYFEPATGLKGLRITEGGVAIGGKGRTVYMSEPYLPHAWNPDYQQTLQFDFVAVSTFGQSVVVLTTGDLYVASGLLPDAMQLTRIEQSYACLSATGVCEGKGGCLFPSNQGLVAIGADFVPVVVTAGLLTQEQWLAYNPSSFKAGIQNGKYHACFTRTDGTTGILVIDPTGKSAPMVERSQIAGQPVRATFHDKTTDTFYVARSSKIQRLEKVGSSSTQYVWRSKDFTFNRPLDLNAFLILGDHGTVQFRAYCDGVLRYTKALPIGHVGRMRIGRKRRWSFEVQSIAAIDEIRIAPSVEELYQ